MELAFGNSQIEAYLGGARLLRESGLPAPAQRGLIFRGERYEPYMQFVQGGARFHPAVSGDLCQAIDEADPTHLVIAVMGSHHWIYGIANEKDPFDFLVPALPQCGLAPGTQLIPYDLVERLFRNDLAWQFGLVRLARTLSDRPIFVIEAPPPVASTEMMLRGLYGPFKERVEQYGTPPAAFRFKVWWIWHRLCATLAAELGAHFVEAPPETRDAEGFLDPRFFLDGVHGNDAYGALMVDRVAHACRTLGIAPAEAT